MVGVEFVAGVFIANADASIVMATYGTISSELGSLKSASWLVVTYGLAMCAIQPMVCQWLYPDSLCRTIPFWCENLKSLSDSMANWAISMVENPPWLSLTLFSPWAVRFGTSRLARMLSPLDMQLRRGKCWYILSGAGRTLWQVVAGRAIGGIGGAGMTSLVSIIIAGMVMILLERVTQLIPSA